ncbi:MAG: hypothetical protein M0Z99_27815 [Betaproteobacteria bacterium]|nr:hypothetical protein [Betaproteobacteria bacterium]
MSIAGALAILLDVVARDSEARCAAILGAARAEAEALRAAVMREGRQRLRAALQAERAGAAARIAAARAQLEAEQRRAEQRRAALAVAAAEALLPAALQAVWHDPARRRQWLEQALVRAAQCLPRSAWRIRHAPDLDADDKAWLQRRIGELGMAGASFEAEPGIDAGIEIHAAAALLEATPAGLLADRAWVYGRLLQLIEQP